MIDYYSRCDCPECIANLHTHAGIVTYYPPLLVAAEYDWWAESSEPPIPFSLRRPVARTNDRRFMAPTRRRLPAIVPRRDFPRCER